LGTCTCAHLRASSGPNSLWHRQCSPGTVRRLECRPGPGIPCRHERSDLRVPYARSSVLLLRGGSSPHNNGITCCDVQGRHKINETAV
jgi:hypothetical protein